MLGAARRLDVRVGAEARERPGRVEDPSARSRRCSVDDVACEVSERRDRAHAGAAPGVTRRATSATTLAIANETRKLGTVAPMPQSGGFSLLDQIDPPRRAGREEPLVEREPGDPGGDQAGPPRRRAEDVVGRVVRSGREPVREEHREERHEHRAEQEQEALVAHEVDDERSDRGDPGDDHDEQLLRRVRHGVLERHRRRVGVRERLVRLRHEQREQRDDRGEAARDDGSRECRRVAEAAREHEHGTEREQPDVGHEVAEPGSGQRAAARPSRTSCSRRRTGPTRP